MTYGGKLLKVMRSEIADWLTPWALSAIEIWHRWRTFNALPFGGGWAEQPAHIIEAIEACDMAHKEMTRGR